MSHQEQEVWVELLCRATKSASEDGGLEDEVLEHMFQQPSIPM